MNVFYGVKAIDAASLVGEHGGIAFGPRLAFTETQELHSDLDLELLSRCAPLNVLADDYSGICSNMESGHIEVSVGLAKSLQSIRSL